MVVKLLRTYLPWVLPVGAIVVAATTGVFDTGKSSNEIARAPQAVASQIAHEAVRAPVQDAVAANAQISDSEAAGIVTRLNIVTDTSLQALQPEPAPQPSVPVAAIEPEIAPVAAPEPSVSIASIEETEETLSFFANASAELAARESCVADLRAVADQTRVYFPAGGLTIDESGIGQARLIAALLEDCPGVKIVVEGHSDPSGNAAVNLRLSKQRAEQVIQRLGAAGYNTASFSPEGLGSQRPSGVIGTEGSAYYDRRVEFVVIETEVTAGTNLLKSTPSAWASSGCVQELTKAVQSEQIFYSARSVAPKQEDVARAYRLASMAMDCPNARLRVIGQHSDALRAGEGPSTGRLRANALLAVLVGQGVESSQIIAAAPSRSNHSETVSGSRLDFDIIVE